MQPSPLGGQDMAELLRLARQGQHEALGELLHRHRPYLLRIANTELPPWVQGKVGGSDVVQNALVEALAGFAQFRGQSVDELRRWCRTILLRQVIQAKRRHRAADQREVPLASSAGDRTAAQESSPSHKVVRQEHSETVRQALERLPAHYRQVLIWREWDDLSFAEIAARCGRSPDAARMLWWRAAERLHEEIGRSP